MIDEERISIIVDSIINALEGLTYLESIAVLETIKHGLLAHQKPYI